MAGSGFKVWADLERIDAAAFNGYVMSQVIPEFASTAARDAAITAPFNGQMARVGRVIYMYTSASGGSWQVWLNGDVWTDWTPTVTQSGSVPITITTAKYMKVGRMVTLRAFLNVTGGGGTGGNAIKIGGLPFVHDVALSFPIGVANVFDASAADDFTGTLRFDGTNNTLEMLSTRANGKLGATSFTAALAASDQIVFTGTYQTTA